MFLTKRQKQNYQYMKERTQDKVYAPSIAEIGEQFEPSSPATVHKYLLHLKSKGLICKHQNISRATEIVGKGSIDISNR